MFKNFTKRTVRAATNEAEKAILQKLPKYVPLLLLGTIGLIFMGKSSKPSAVIIHINNLYL